MLRSGAFPASRANRILRFSFGDDNTITEIGTLEIHEPDGNVVSAFSNNNAGARAQVMLMAVLETPEAGAPAP